MYERVSQTLLYGCMAKLTDLNTAHLPAKLLHIMAIWALFGILHVA